MRRVNKQYFGGSVRAVGERQELDMQLFCGVECVRQLNHLQKFGDKYVDEIKEWEEEFEDMIRDLVMGILGREVSSDADFAWNKDLVEHSETQMESLSDLMHEALDNLEGLQQPHMSTDPPMDDQEKSLRATKEKEIEDAVQTIMKALLGHEITIEAKHESEVAP